MTSFRIVEASTSATGYRGVDRPPPAEPDPRNLQSAEAFEWYVSHVRQDGTLEDFTGASRVVRAYDATDPQTKLELLEVGPPAEEPGRGRLLGFDIASGSYSLLSWGLDLGREPRMPIEPRDPYWALLPLLKVVGNYYRPRLNEAGLFGDAGVARECLEVLDAAQQLRPSLWSDPSDRFDVIRVTELTPS